MRLRVRKRSEANLRPQTQRQRLGFLSWLVRAVPLQLAPEPLPEGMSVGVKAELIRQEHRLIPVVQNAFRYWKLPEDDPRRLAALEASIFRIFASPAAQTATIGLLGLITAAATIFLAYRANVIGERQAKQALIQNALAEAQRMAVLSEQITQVSKDFANAPKHGSRDAQLLEVRVLALSRSLLPYKYLEWSKEEAGLSTEMISRERSSLLLICLAASKAGYGCTYNFIYPWVGTEVECMPFYFKLPTIYVDDNRFYANADFSYADCSGAYFSSQDFSKLDLDNARFRKLGGELKFHQTSLENAVFEGVPVHKQDVSLRDLFNVIHGVDLGMADFTSANLTGTVFRDVRLPPSAMFNRAVCLQPPVFENCYVNDPNWLRDFKQNVVFLTPNAAAKLEELELVEVEQEPERQLPAGFYEVRSKRRAWEIRPKKTFKWNF